MTQQQMEMLQRQNELMQNSSDFSFGEFDGEHMDFNKQFDNMQMGMDGQDIKNTNMSRNMANMNMNMQMQMNSS